MTIEEFAKKIKAKYPQYQDIPDAELGQKMLAKYPQYQEQIQNTPEVKRPLFDRVIDNPVTRGIQAVFPGKQIGEALGTSIASIGQFVKGDFQGAADTANSIQTSPLRVAGDITSGAASLAGFKGVGVTGAFTRRLLSNAGLGAAITGGSAVAEGKSGKEAVKSAAIGGVVGAALPVVGAGLRAIGNQIDNLPTRFIESALGRKKAVVLNDLRKGGETLPQYIIKNKPIGTAETMYNSAEEAVETLGNNIQAKLASAATKTGKTVTLGRDNILDTVAQLPEAQGALLRRGDVRAVIERLAPQAKQILQKPSLTLTDANKLRQLLDRTLGDKGFLSAQQSTDKLILRSFANTLRETVKTRAPVEVRGLFSELAKEIQIRDALLAKMAGRSSQLMLTFGDIVGGGLGGVFGSLLGNPVAGATAGFATRRAVESVPFKVGAAKIIDAITKAGPVLESLSPAQQTAILNLVSEIISANSPEQISNTQSLTTERELTRNPQKTEMQASSSSNPTMTEEEKQRVIDMTMGFGPMGVAGATRQVGTKALLPLAQNIIKQAKNAPALFERIGALVKGLESKDLRTALSHLEDNAEFLKRLGLDDLSPDKLLKVLDDVMKADK